MNKIIIGLPLLATLAIASITMMMLSPAYAQLPPIYMDKEQLEQIRRNMTRVAPPPTTTTAPTTTPTTDLELQKFDQIAYSCQATIQKMYPSLQKPEDVFMKAPSASTTPADWDQVEQCNMLLRQGIAQYCNTLASYDAIRCAHVNTPQVTDLINESYVIAKQKFLFGQGGLASGSTSGGSGSGLFGGLQ